MNSIYNAVVQAEPFVGLLRAVRALAPGDRLTLKGAAGSLPAFVAARIVEETGRQLLLIASGEERAEKLCDDCTSVSTGARVRLFAHRPLHRAETTDAGDSMAQIEALGTLVTGLPAIVVASPQSVIERVPLPKDFTGSFVKVVAGSETGFGGLLEQLDAFGFTRRDFVEGYGDYAVRGGILDVFSFSGDNPFRIEFWGNSVESIREFDVLSQRSIQAVPSITIVPENPGGGAEGEGEPDREPPGSLFDYLSPEALVLMDEPALIRREIDGLERDGVKLPMTHARLLREISHFPAVMAEAAFSRGTPEGDVIDLEARPQPAFNGSIAALVRGLGGLSEEGYTLRLAADTEEEARRLGDLIEDVLTAPGSAGGDPGGEALRTGIQNVPIPLGIAQGAIHNGFVYAPGKLAVFTEHEIFGREKRRGKRARRRVKGLYHKEVRQLRPGDFLVHIDRGIGRFEGLQSISVGGAEQEVMKVAFMDNDILYVNLNYVDRIQKYSSQEGHTPVLTKLGTPDWERKKAKAKSRIKDIARDLIALYARRKQEKGFAFSPDSHWQKELEASFVYEDTPDQARATLEVKADMESASPMDRLVCGDVGFGKTEVAVRAAFKAVLDGKQVAVLVPTTILALQHHNTFRDRLSRYSVRVDNITRFRTAKDQKAVLKGLTEGGVDIVIGTHRLLSADVAFKDLGLLVVDEEHRFGVAAKEKLRALRASVDTLAMTATPIPRTLHFSLIGARDLSLIASPPKNRLPIHTEIIPAGRKGRRTEWQVIREAVLAELRRGGQVYFVHDRVHNIEAVAGQVKTHVPEARVHVAHGQMAGHELEKTMVDFLERRYDVLVCTKIIESGLDIPNANTIIVNNADRFGLAELYQLRGRVGRSNMQAYAVLLTPPLSAVPKATVRRLQAIEEFTELGSGFTLAMRDLEIRGAGNLLGAEQSGFIMEMGFEMYERILREAVEELKEEEFREVLEGKEGQGRAAPLKEIAALVDADISALIPPVYLESAAERLDVYRRLYRARSRAEIDSLRSELRDRFGEYPEETENLFRIVEIRLAAASAGFRKVEIREETCTVTLPESENRAFYGADGDAGAPFQRLVAAVAALRNKAYAMKQEGEALLVSGRMPELEATRAERALEVVRFLAGAAEGSGSG